MNLMSGDRDFRFFSGLSSRRNKSHFDAAVHSFHWRESFLENLYSVLRVYLLVNTVLGRTHAFDLNSVWFVLDWTD